MVPPRHPRDRLPDQHVKSTIVPQAIDLAGRRLGYFHNAGYFELEGEDFAGRLASASMPARLPPYVELVRLERLRPDGPSLAEVVSLTRQHLTRRPPDNPIARMAKRIDRIERVRGAWHRLSTGARVGTCRQCGASADVAATFVDRLDARDGGGLQPASESFRRVAEGAKTLQFGLARVISGRRFDVQAPLGEMAKAWDGAMDVGRRALWRLTSWRTRHGHVVVRHLTLRRRRRISRRWTFGRIPRSCPARPPLGARRRGTLGAPRLRRGRLVVQGEFRRDLARPVRLGHRWCSHTVRSAGSTESTAGRGRACSSRRRVQLPALGARRADLPMPSLGPWLVARRPRPHWLTPPGRRQTLRYVRTTLLGRIPPWSEEAARRLVLGARSRWPRRRPALSRGASPGQLGGRVRGPARGGARDSRWRGRRRRVDLGRRGWRGAGASSR